ncbi:unnamed protein product [Penicillium glandicola]
MSPVKQKTGSGTIRRQLLSLSSAFRSQSSKRTSVITDAVPEEPTCLERIHYPVFNPLDPRHNPEISASSWGSHERSSSSGSRSPMTWVQSISRRSLHRARSGLLALRSGFTRRSSEEDNLEKSFVSPVALRRERQNRGLSSGVYTEDTQEDLTFGAELSRMNLPPSSPSSNADMVSLIRVPSMNSTHDSLATVPASASAPKLHQVSDRAVSNYGLNSTCTLANDHDLDFQFAGTGELEANMHSGDHFAHATRSTEVNLIQQTWGVAVSTDEEVEMSAHALADHESVWGEQQSTNLQQNISHASSDTEISDDQTSTVPISRQSSAEVEFAFPGIYHEALDQWARQDGIPSPSQHIPRHSEHSPNLSENSPSPSQHSSNPSQHIPRLYGQEATPRTSQEPLECILLQGDTNNNMPYHEHDESLIPLVPLQPPLTHSEDMQPFSYPNPLHCITNRDFGERWSSISERATTQWSSVEEYSSRYTTDDNDTTSRHITSTEMTSMESTSNDAWSPWSPVDSEVLFPSPVEDGNEYFFVDGKTNRQYPDRGNQPVKSAQHTTSNCDNTRGAQEVTEVTSPGILSLRFISDGITGAGLDFVEEDTDDEFYPGIVQPRQVW